MKKQNYIEEFKKLGINIEPLPKNYNSNTFGESLMSKFRSDFSNVSYSASTNYVKNNNTSGSNPRHGD